MLEDAPGCTPYDVAIIVTHRSGVIVLPDDTLLMTKLFAVHQDTEGDKKYVADFRCAGDKRIRIWNQSHKWRDYVPGTLYDVVIDLTDNLNVLWPDSRLLPGLSQCRGEEGSIFLVYGTTGKTYLSLVQSDPHRTLGEQHMKLTILAHKGNKHGGLHQESSGYPLFLMPADRSPHRIFRHAAIIASPRDQS